MQTETKSKQNAAPNDPTYTARAAADYPTQ